MPTSGGTGGPGIGRVAVRADAIEGGRRHRVERDGKRDIDSAPDEPLREQAGDRLPRTIVLGRRAPGDWREHCELHRPGRGAGYRRAWTPPGVRPARVTSSSSPRTAASPAAP